MSLLPIGPAPTPSAGTLSTLSPGLWYLIPGITIAIKNASIAILGKDEKVAGGALDVDLITGLDGFESLQNHDLWSDSALSLMPSFISSTEPLPADDGDRTEDKPVEFAISSSSKPTSLNTDLLPSLPLYDRLEVELDFTADGRHLSDSRRRSEVLVEQKLGLWGRGSVPSVFGSVVVQSPGLNKDVLELDGMMPSSLNSDEFKCGRVSIHTIISN